MGFNPYQYGQPVAAAIVQTDHAEYMDLVKAMLPGVKTILDGRGVLKEENFPGVRLHILGHGSTFLG
jgi:hypothetical protein